MTHPNTIYVICPALKQPKSSAHRQDQQEEMVRLVKSLYPHATIHSEQWVLQRISPRFYVGQGKVDELAAVLEKDPAMMVVLDAPISAIHQRNLERHWKCDVCDRTAIILRIFGERARTSEGKVQVELAQAEYERSRVVGSWEHLERQRGGLGATGGMGEKQIEIDRRLLDIKIRKLKDELERVHRSRAIQRKARTRIPLPVIALVGYTNAGKSTLFNALTGAGVLAEDKLFATLDPTVRAVRLPSGRKVAFSDTVGFISQLPHQLVNAFHATLEEVQYAAMILHVRDITHPSHQEHRQDVLDVLEGLEVNEDGHYYEIWNKADMLDNEAYASWQIKASEAPNVVLLSAKEKKGIDPLLSMIDDYLGANETVHHVTVPFEDGALMAWLHEHASITDKQTGDAGWDIEVRMSDAVWHEWQVRSAPSPSA